LITNQEYHEALHFMSRVETGAESEKIPGREREDLAL